MTDYPNLLSPTGSEEAKLDDAESLQDASSILSKRELKALLSDERGSERLLALVRAGTAWHDS